MRQRILTGLLFAWLLSGTGVQAQTTHRPVLDRDFPDPFILPVGNGLVAYATNTWRDGRRLNVQMSRSGDGGRWSAPVDAMPVLPDWVRAEAPDIWAPEVVKVGATYVMYFAGRHKSLKRPDGLTLCIGAAVSASALGPFRPLPQPLTCGEGLGAIDPSPLRDGDDLWLYVKSDGNCCGAPIRILAGKLSAEGTALTGPLVKIEGLTNDQPWEGAVIEGEEMIRHDGRYYMFYAANDYGGDHYATGYARCDQPTGPCRDAEENPVLKSQADLVGPGHQSIFVFRGQMFMAYHAWRQGPASGRRYRALYIEALGWNDGRPYLLPARVP